MGQLPLPLRLDDHALFATFHAAGNEVPVAHLTALAEGRSNDGCWIWGAPSSGKTHLLQAVCELAGDRSAYIPLSTVAEAGPDVLEGLASRELVCIDDIDRVAGHRWEIALFTLCNEIFEAGGQLIAAAAVAPRESGLELADLRSRLSRLPVFHIHSLDDAERVKALQLRAHHRGLNLPRESARYLMSRARRDMASLYDLLDKLDAEALKAQRRLTIPFVRDVMLKLTAPPS